MEFPLGKENQHIYFFQLLLAQFVLSLLRLQETVEFFLLLTLDVLLELLLIIAKCFCLSGRVDIRFAR